MKKRGFTFIELLISVFIMTIMWVSWIYFLQNYFVWQNLELKLESIKNDITYFDFNIKENIINSYELTFFSWNTLWYIVNENFFDKINLIDFSNLNLINFSWSIKTFNTSTGVWLLKTYFDEILNKTYISIWSWEIIDFNFSNNLNKTYTIKSNIDWLITNNLKITYFIKDNIFENEDTKKIKLVSLSWANIYNKVVIKNILWNKEILWFTWVTEYEKINEVYLKFERWWQELNLLLNK
jgi:prepilin-type N-terminal cleavage/methylation domain-containing protein